MTTTAPDTAPLKEIQKFIWSQGDFAELALQVMPSAEALVIAAGVAPADEVLDVAAGTGNVAAIAAARGARVTASDITPKMVELGRARCAAEGIDVTWLEADAEALPFPDGSFDRVLSSFGAMFAPRPEVAAAELFRVARPGGTVGMLTWAPESYPARNIRTVASFMPPRPAGVPDPVDWGEEAIVRERLAGLAETVEISRGTVTMEHPSLDAAWDFQQRNLGPLVAARMALGDRFTEVETAIRDVMADINSAADGTVRMVSPYLLIVARKAA